MTRVLVINAGSSSLKVSVDLESASASRWRARRWTGAPMRHGSPIAAPALKQRTRRPARRTIRRRGASRRARRDSLPRADARRRRTSSLELDVAVRAGAAAQPDRRRNDPATTRRCCPTCRQWPCSTPHFTRHCPAMRTSIRCPGPWYADWGVRRFGFHGLSVEWSVRRAAELLGTPVRVAIAGRGSSR